MKEGPTDKLFRGAAKVQNIVLLKTSSSLPLSLSSDFSRMSASASAVTLTATCGCPATEGSALPVVKAATGCRPCGADLHNHEDTNLLGFDKAHRILRPFL